MVRVIRGWGFSPAGCIAGVPLHELNRSERECIMHVIWRKLNILALEQPMKRFIVIICALLAAGLLPLMAQQKGPSIEFDSVNKVVSKVTDGEIITQVFKFTNKGDAQLEILAVEPTCGCTTALPVPNKLAPGQTGQIEVKITTTGLAAQLTTVTESVPMSKTIIVKTNDAKQPQVVLTVNSNISQEIAISEPSVYFGSNPRGQAVTKELFVEIAPDKPIKLLGAISTDENVTVKLEPVAGSNAKKFKLIAVQKPMAVEGYHLGEIRITTSSQLKPEIKIPVRGLVKGS